MKHLNLIRPIVFFDIETTGLNLASDRIVEITVLKIQPDGPEKYISILINPEIPIPLKVTSIHGITDTDVADKPKFRQYAKSLIEFFSDCDIGGFNIKKYDLPMLEAEFRRAGIRFSRVGRSVIDPMVIFHKQEPRDLKAAYKRYCGKDLANGHRSEVDVRATIEILESQLGALDELPRDTQELHRYCCFEGECEWLDPEGKLIWCDDIAMFNFGIHKGETLNNVAANNPDYLSWIIGRDFSPELKEILVQALKGIFPGHPKSHFMNRVINLAT